ncbi:toll/interleukin-1 receptor domain-containing protein [Pseudomonas akapageensis]|uniref:toll/interleukin-1 receptor domain-containing protein n=1 Tax=Pseudomonas akapageensis TaxID=2609961 RepID=UPI001408DDE3|nr:toll/interleukin-1 receptor domain-containing protein [Pseudomonas akapageensis]
MADVFISYASEDRERAAQLASTLGEFGWSVWWDRKIIPGQAFDHVIEHELESARSVIVLWSQRSIESEWVRNEAAVAMERGVLVPAMIERLKLPLEFRRKQTADLVDWEGDSSHSGFQALCEGVNTLIGGAPLQQAMPYPVQRKRRSPRWALAAIVALVVAVGMGVYLISPSRTITPPPASQDNNSEINSPSEDTKPVSAVTGLADLVIGTYSGDVIADSKGSSRSDIDVTITKLDRYTVRVTSDYHRFGTVDVTLTRIGNKIFNAEGDSPFIVDLDRNPPALTFNPHNELAYGGTKQK